jgi:hypothetical protein
MKEFIRSNGKILTPAAGDFSAAKGWATDGSQDYAA